MTSHAALLAAAATALVLAACGPADTPASAPPASPAPVAGDPLPAEPLDTSPIVADWDPAAEPVVLPAGHTIRHCVGDRPALCVWKGDTELGLLEALRFPAPAELDGEDGEALDTAMRAFAAARVADVASDRADGCGPDHEVVADAPASVTVAGGPGLRYGFTTVVGGTVVEHVVTWATLRNGDLHLLVASAVTRDGCMADGLLSFAPDVLTPLLPVLDRVAAGTPLLRTPA